MGEWWTYRPSDFLMFSASAYARLLELANRELWPLHVAMAVLAAAVLGSVLRPSPVRQRAAALALAATWAWVAWGVLWSRLAQINTIASYLGWAFAVQALALAALAALPPARPAATWPGAGAALLAAGVLLWPGLGPVTGRSWAQAEYFGIAAEPTALATLGWLLGSGVRHRAWAAVIPLGSLGVGAATLWLLYGPP